MRFRPAVASGSISLLLTSGLIALLVTSAPRPIPMPAAQALHTMDVMEPPSPATMAPAELRAPPAAYATTPYGSPENTERYDGQQVASIQSVATAPVSTFSVDVDTGSYANVRRFINQGEMPPAEAVRTEEMINYFRYDYPRPTDRNQPFSVTTNVSTTPWNPESRLLRIGLRAYDVTTAQRPRANLVFLVDVSGSMEDADKLPLVKGGAGAPGGPVASGRPRLDHRLCRQCGHGAGADRGQGCGKGIARPVAGRRIHRWRRGYPARLSHCPGAFHEGRRQSHLPGDRR